MPTHVVRHTGSCILLACVACAEAPRRDPVASMTGVSVGTAGDDAPAEEGAGAATAMPPATEGGPASSTTDATSEPADSTAASGPVLHFDLGTVPDAPPSTGVVGIPETCAQARQTQSTVGCSFHANKMQNFIEEPTSIIVGNVSETESATVELYWGPGGVETPEGGAVVVGPLQAHEFVLDHPLEPGDVSVHRDGGAFRVQSDRPIVAYQHSPISAQAHNDSSMLIPDHALGQFYIVAAWNTSQPGHTSAFNVVGISDGTTVQWQPPNPTSGGAGVSAVAAFGTGSATIDRFDLLQVIAPTDASGTIIETSAPAWVMGTVPCVNVPVNVTFCDHIEELLIPLEYWGTDYVGAHAPNRGSEQYWWRVYSGADGVTITTEPPQSGTPVTLDRGEFHEFATQESFIFTGDGPFMPVQYLEGQDGGAGTGDPASYQMVPTEQFLPVYVFVTGTGYTENYVQIIRPLGSADVLVDGVVVTGYYEVGAFEVADWPITQGAHEARSEVPFGVIQVGYTDVTSYAYPGGLALAFINPNPEG
jgi:hypothetical protein